MDQLNDLNGWYLFQLIVLLKPDFNFILSWVDKVTTGTWSFVSVTANFSAPVELVITQLEDHVKILSTFSVLPLSGVLPVIFN